MKEISKKELQDILKAHPEGGVVFVPPDDQMVHISYESDFGATCLEIDEDGEPYCYDWSINEYGDDEIFKLYEENDILALVKVLKRSLLINAQKQQPKTWIPVSERLPEKYKEVIVTDIETSDTYQSYYIGDGYWECDNGAFKNRIIAWMPFPEKYEEGENNE